MKRATDIIESVQGVIEPECLSDSGCKPLEGFVMRKGLTSPEREELLARCVEYCLSKGTEQVCVMSDSVQVSEADMSGELDA